jgi:hypothetical protein
MVPPRGTRLGGCWGASWVSGSAVGVDAEQGVGVGVADPDRARADRQPAAVNGLGAGLEGVHPWLAAGSMRCSSPPLASTHTLPAPAATALGRCWPSRQTVVVTRRLAGSIRARVELPR